jgi:methylmalonyl-CoA mutase C-terminal domain/subunit
MSKKRIILAKVGLDSHDNGLRIIARWLMDRGYEVIYAGVYNSPEGVVNTAVQEHVHAIGVSFLGGGHLFYADRLLRLMKESGVTDVALFAGGVISGCRKMKGWCGRRVHTGTGVTRFAND